MADADNYDVGYGKPPKNSRFPKGKTGNPKGRPVGSTYEALMEKHLAKIIHTGAHGPIPLKEALVIKVLEQALRNNDARMQRWIIENFPGPQDPTKKAPVVIRLRMDNDLRDEPTPSNQ